MPVCPKCRETNPKLGAKCPRDGFYFIEEGALEQAEEDPRIGQLTAEKFVIVDLISEGGMGAVYKAIQLPVEREVAVKVLRAELEDSDQGRDRFIREARAVSKLTHPNVITLHDFGFEDSGHPYMVMEYAPGLSLAGWLQRGNLTVPRIIHVLQQILSALSDAHKRGIVHRDLKPENLIVTQTGNDQDYIKLLDFGIARLVNEGATRGLTREGEVFGTPHYMSPEQAQGSTDIGPPADVYALGIIAYELFAGSPPFDASTPLSVLYMHINDELPTLRPRAGLEPPDAAMHVIRTSTQKSPQDRYQTAGEMLADLNQRLTEEGVAGDLPYSAGANQSGQFPIGTGSQQSSDSVAPSDRSSSGETVVLNETEDEGSPADRSLESPARSNTSPTWAHAPPTGDVDTQQSIQTEAERKKRIIMVAAGLLAFVATVAISSVFLFDGNSNDTAAADAAKVEEPPETQPSETQEKSPTAAKIADDEPDTPTEPESIKADEEQQEVGSETGAEAKDADAGDDNTLTFGEDESMTEDEKTAAETAAEAKAEPKPTPRPRPRPSRSTSDDDDEPEKFEPAKFKPAKKSDDDSDDEPEKFEPSKWR